MVKFRPRGNQGGPMGPLCYRGLAGAPRPGKPGGVSSPCAIGNGHQRGPTGIGIWRPSPIWGPLEIPRVSKARRVRFSPAGFAVRVLAKGNGILPVPREFSWFLACARAALFHWRWKEVFPKAPFPFCPQVGKGLGWMDSQGALG